MLHFWLRNLYNFSLLILDFIFNIFNILISLSDFLSHHLTLSHYVFSFAYLFILPFSYIIYNLDSLLILFLIVLNKFFSPIALLVEFILFKYHILLEKPKCHRILDCKLNFFWVASDKTIFKSLFSWSKVQFHLFKSHIFRGTVLAISCLSSIWSSSVLI